MALRLIACFSQRMKYQKGKNVRNMWDESENMLETFTVVEKVGDMELILFRDDDIHCL